jgi:hypothetical protein
MRVLDAMIGAALEEGIPVNQASMYEAVVPQGW